MILIRQAEIYAIAENNPGQKSQTIRSHLDVRCSRGKIVEIGPSLKPQCNELIIEANNGVLIPGLHDHHIHLLALAASLQSVRCGPPDITNIDSFAQALQNARGDGWIRGFGYHESVAGPLHRKQLDELVPSRPLRIQHRSGKMWFVNSMAARILNLENNRSVEGVECDSNGSPNGRLFRLDSWLRDRLGKEALPDIRTASQKLASFGVTGITDVTPDNSTATRDLFLRLIEKGDLLQRVRLMGDKSLKPVKHPFLETGSLKIMLDEYALPDYEDFKQDIVSAHQQKRSVAVHCVTLSELVFALSAFRETGTYRGDRIEHASMSGDDTLPLLHDTGVTVVTQPNFIRERGDQYLRDIGADALHQLYRAKSLLEAGIPLAAGTDAPFGDPDPWLAMRAAVNRQTRSGKVLGEPEKLTPEQALRLFTTTAAEPGGVPRSVTVGKVADLCLLARPWREARTLLSRQDVNLTLRAGKIIYQKSPA